jgi:hypothetical protein
MLSVSGASVQRKFYILPIYKHINLDPGVHLSVYILNFQMKTMHTDPWFEAHIIMHSLPKMHEVNIYRAGHVNLYVGMFPLQNN